MKHAVYFEVLMRKSNTARRTTILCRRTLPEAKILAAEARDKGWSLVSIWEHKEDGHTEYHQA